MNKAFLIFTLGILMIAGSCSNKQQLVRIAVSTDVHGSIFPYDPVQQRETQNSLAHMFSYIKAHDDNPDTLMLVLDNGDFLQGSPGIYYYNFIDTLHPHLASSVLNYMGYDAASVGNHDIEAGPAVYRRLEKDYAFPWLAANAVFEANGEPAFEPYAILHAGAFKVAVLGLITPGIPNWLPKTLWPDMVFEDMTETAQKWIPRIQEKEKPDLIIGLFHSGTDLSYGGNPEPYLNENASLHIAKTVPGFDAIFAGHDHQTGIYWVLNPEGDSVVVIDPGSHARFAGELLVELAPAGAKIKSAKNVDLSGYQPSAEFIKAFENERLAIDNYLEDTVCWLAADIEGLDALFGPSSISTLIHQLQLDLSGADISFTAPLSLNAHLREGPLRVADMFSLYRFENMLYVMELTGREINGFLEHAADNWFATMKSKSDHMLRFSENEPGRLAHPYFNFSSAAGIDYTVDLREEAGSRISILQFSDGRCFHPDSSYRVALNSYRGNGGGGHLTAGSGIASEDLSKRVLWSSTSDLRFHLMKNLETRDTLFPDLLKNWNALPERWVSSASLSDRKLFE